MVLPVSMFTFKVSLFQCYIYCCRIYNKMDIYLTLYYYSDT